MMRSTFGADTQDDMFVLWVANEGAPIPPHTLEHLFQPFFRGKALASSVVAE